jgi:hypothetical protein
MKKLMVLLLMLALCGLSQAELLTANRGFEYGDTTDWLQWGSGGSPWQSWYDTWGVVSDGTAHSGDYYLNIAQNHYGNWAYNVAWQGEATTIPGVAGETYTLSYWARSNDATRVVVKFEASDGDWANNKWQQEINPEITPDGTWQFFSESFIAPVGTTELRAVVGGNETVFSIDIDDVSLVPEPMTIALLGLGGLFIRRRKA